MNKDMILQTIQAVINTLNGATLRADQHDAYQRISACTNERQLLMQEIDKPEPDEKKEG